jgi:peptidyl-prolyl cis-trans isomerase A (cyclophilin A)
MDAFPTVNKLNRFGNERRRSFRSPQSLVKGCHDRLPAQDRKVLVAEQTFAVIHTSMGDITVQLFPDHAPATVKNFIDLAQGTREWTDPRTTLPSNEPLYSGTIFHRVIAGFMIQGGDPLGTGTGGPGYTFKDEFHSELIFDRKYLLAMANAGPATNGSQFFITVVATPWLTMKHTIFGEVADAESQDVVEAIAGVRTGPRDRPSQDVTIKSIDIERRQV